jgi:hypothetical protein
MPLNTASIKLPYTSHCLFSRLTKISDRNFVSSKNREGPSMMIRATSPPHGNSAGSAYSGIGVRDACRVLFRQQLKMIACFYTTLALVVLCGIVPTCPILGSTCVSALRYLQTCLSTP